MNFPKMESLFIKFLFHLLLLNLLGLVYLLSMKAHIKEVFFNLSVYLCLSTCEWFLELSPVGDALPCDPAFQPP